MRSLLLTALAPNAGALFAQSNQAEAEAILTATRNLPVTSTTYSWKSIPLPPSGAGGPEAQNVLTILGDYTPQTPPVLLPCFYCISGAAGSNIGLVQPDTHVSADGTSQYLLNNYFVSRSYRGSCTFGLLVRDEAGGYPFKVSFDLDVIPNVAYELSTVITLPNDSTIAGEGLVATVTTCGPVSSYTGMQINITNP